jgi:hypothetical protein
MDLFKKGIGQYLTICTGQLVEFLGSDFQSSGPCHIVFFNDRGLNNYLKVTNVRNEPREFYYGATLTNFGDILAYLVILKITFLSKGRVKQTYKLIF